MMRILLVSTGEFYYIGAFFNRALQQLGHEHRFFDEWDYLKLLQRSLLHKVAYHTLGRRPLTYWAINRRVLQVARCFRPQVILVTMGHYVRPSVLAQIKAETGATLINYATDDPLNMASSTRNVIKAIPLYDIYATPRRAIIPDLRRAGCRNPVFLPFGYEPSLHFPEQPANADEARRWTSDVVFAGGCDQDRVLFFAALSRLPNLKLHLYGGYWDRVPKLRPHYRGFVFGREYRLALGGTKIAPCLVRRSNRDEHVMRTFEIPACGAFMLAERTDEHLELFEEGKEMACFGSPEELVDKVRYYLVHDEERRRIAEAGYRRVISEHHTYKDRLIEILSMVQG